MSDAWLRYTKWGGRPHWEFDATFLGNDEWGSWLYTPGGTAMVRPGVTLDLVVGQVTLVSPDRAYTPGFFATWEAPPERTHYEIYVDMTTPPQWDGVVARMVDLDLDVVRHKDGRVEVLDEDEFAAHRVEYGYPAELCGLAATTRDEVVAALRANHEPYATVGWRWLERAAG